MLWAESMELLVLGGGFGNLPVSYHVSCLINSKLTVDTAFQTPPGTGLMLYWKPIQSGETGTAAECVAVSLSVPGDAPCVRPHLSLWHRGWGTGAHFKIRAACGLSLCPCSVCASTIQANL